MDVKKFQKVQISLKLSNVFLNGGQNLKNVQILIEIVREKNCLTT
jgi:hypothetical protein